MDATTSAPQPKVGSSIVKIVLLGCGALGLIVVLLAGGIFYLAWRATQGPVDGANQFLKLVSEGKTKEAHASGSSAFRQAASVEDIDALSQQFKLDQFLDTTFTNRNISNNNARISGTLRTKTESMPITVDLVYYDDAWHVENLRLK